MFAFKRIDAMMKFGQAYAGKTPHEVLPPTSPDGGLFFAAHVEPKLLLLESRGCMLGTWLYQHRFPAL